MDYPFYVEKSLLLAKKGLKKVKPCRLYFKTMLIKNLSDKNLTRVDL